MKRGDIEYDFFQTDAVEAYAAGVSGAAEVYFLDQSVAKLIVVDPLAATVFTYRARLRRFGFGVFDPAGGYDELEVFRRPLEDAQIQTLYGLRVQLFEEP